MAQPRTDPSSFKPGISGSSWLDEVREDSRCPNWILAMSTLQEKFAGIALLASRSVGFEPSSRPCCSWARSVGAHPLAPVTAPA